MEKILVAADGSDNSKRALIEAEKYAECFGGEITIVTVVEPLGRYTTVGYIDIPVDEELKSEGQLILKDSLKLIDDFKGQAKTKIRIGNPADEILKEAEIGDYDLIIMGSRGLGAFSRTIVGSVSSNVLNHTKRSVLIVK